jgi:rod shape-determining protein MreC
VAPQPGRSRTVLGLLVLASVTIITLDARHETAKSPVDPMRTAVGSVLGPVEDAAAAALRPITALPDHFGNVDDLRQDNANLQADNESLQSQLRAAEANSNRNEEINRIATLADTSGYDVVPAEVVAIGSAQSFSRTVTVNAGTSDGVVPDLTVLNADGLVGRVIEATRSSATVLLIVDSKSTTGGRLGESMELGFLVGDGSLSGDGALDLSLVDHTVSPQVGDSVVTWGSRNGAPYIAGVPIGEVVSVHASPAELTETARVKPYVDFSSLDIVAVVTDTHARGGATNNAATTTNSRDTANTRDSTISTNTRDNAAEDNAASRGNDR